MKIVHHAKLWGSWIAFSLCAAACSDGSTSSEADAGPRDETDEDPGDETDEDPGDEADAGPGDETDAGPGDETDAGPRDETDAGDVIDSDSGMLPACDERSELSNEMFSGGTVLEAGTCWTVTQNLRLDDGTVTIEEGVSIWFDTGVSVDVNTGGQLTIAGTEARQVEFTTSDPLITWKGIRLTDSQGSNNDWEHVTISNAGASRWTGAGDSAAAVYLGGATTLTMDHVSIETSQAHGLLANGDVSFAFNNGAFIDNETPAYVHPEVAHGIGGETEFSGNTNSYVSVVFGNNDTVDTAQTWAALAVPWRAEDRFFVEEALTLEPGVTIEFEQGVSMRVRGSGSLIAEGTVDAPITLRGASAGTRGYWQGIDLQVGGTDEPIAYGATFDHVVIEDAGSTNWSGAADSAAALNMTSVSSALITNTVFRNNLGFGIRASDDARIAGFADNTFEGNARAMFLHPNRLDELSGTSTISGNDEDRVHVVFGNNDHVDVAATWKDMGVPYRITDRFFIAAALTIEAGATFEVGPDVRIVVEEEEGSLTTAGTPEAPVTFTGVNEVAAGYWTGIQFLSNSPNNSLSHTVITYAGSDAWTGATESHAAVYVGADAMLSLTDVNLGPGGGYGVFRAAPESILGCTDVTFTDLVAGAVRIHTTDEVMDGC